MSKSSHAPEMKTAPPCYAVYYAAMIPIATEHGYSLAIHGSMIRDCDLIAVPWIEDASSAVDLILALKEAINGVFTKHDWDHILTVDQHSVDKPHGRMAWTLHLTNEGMNGPYFDISVMPRSKSGKRAPLGEINKEAFS